jgi:uncharacterized protein YndB with AHSA1/START domain
MLGAARTHRERVEGAGSVADDRFVTTWRLDAPVKAVFDALVQSERWPGWTISEG